MGQEMAERCRIVLSVFVGGIHQGLQARKGQRNEYSVPKWPVYGRARPSRRAFGDNSPSKARIFVILPVYM